MFLLNPDTAKITPADLQGLVDNEVPESRDIEYKRIVGIGPTADQKKKIKLLAGISSFANTDGGDFLVGVQAVNGIPKAVMPIDRDELDNIKLAIEQLVQTGISPRIAPFLHEIRVSETQSVLLVRIAKSWAAPHRVILAGDNNFYGRHSAGMYPMDVDQIRIAFSLTSAIHERIHQTRERLLSAIRLQDSRKLCDPPWVVLHLIPFESLDPSRVFDLRPEAGVPVNTNLTPLGQQVTGAGYSEIRFNFDGVASILEKPARGPKRVLGYTQLFRSGIIESVDAGIGMRLSGRPKTILHLR